ncbi:restriction endonuclease subunit S [Vibrio kanaloae]|uniref:restriction endonuclease subunit S n=1 Tax=Vibrio kanaloae TaxID=170673 RepID=UPI0010BEC114|nr:restriction endonuclease subunit S [Vibrio kanaloae]TKF01302.1 restriction endonuclease subunit S [Vibrio kanaloae]TKF20773.1 restriction endonuclease subunit S [Vibrio kanaloae]
MSAEQTSMDQLITDNIDVWTSTVKAKPASGRGSSKKRELYGVKKLRELILELAVRGKLVPQDPTDEPVSVLLERIAEKKAQLVKDKIISRTKALPALLDEDTPNDLPKGWSMVRLGNLTSKLGSGSTPRGGKNVYTTEGIPFLRSQNVRNEGIKLDDIAYIPVEVHQKMDKTKVIPSDVLLNITGASLGRSTVFPESLVEANVSQHVTIIRLIERQMSQFVHLGILSPMVQRLVWGRQVGMAIEGLSKKVLEMFEFPVPPLKEQHRIVAKVDELMTLCDQLEQQTEASIAAHQVLVTTLLDTLTNSADTDELMQNWARISEHFDTLFTTEASIDQLKQTILQLAVMGKLVPQNPSDEPAAKLLERIAEEKAQLIKDKKIKKQKALPPIADDEKPFELPNGWEWCYLQGLFSVVTDGDHQAPPRADSGVPFLVIGNLNTGNIKFEDCKFVPDSYYQKLDWTRQPVKGDLLYTVTGSYGIPIVVKENKPFCVQRHVAILNSIKNTPIEFIRYVLLSKYSFDFATSVATGIAQKTVPLSGLRRMPVPLPPKNEVLAILEKIDVMMSICDQLKARLKDSQTTQIHLTDAIVEQVM